MSQEAKIKAMLQKGLKLLKAEKFSEASEEFIFITMKDASNLQAHLMLIKCYIEMGDLMMAEKQLEIVLDMHPKDMNVMNAAFTVYKTIPMKKHLA